jgi:hypothetical protein
MTIDPISCPYCNALLTEVDPKTASGRILCPRCGETFPFVPNPLAPFPKREGGEEVPQVIDRSPFSREPEASASAKRWSNRTIAFLVLALMGVVAILFLGFALQTEHIRREHDEMLPKAQTVTIPIGIALVCNVYIVALIFAVVRPKERPGALPVTILLSGLTAIIVTTGLMRVHLRRSSNPYPEELSPYPPINSVAPPHLSGLRYLPADTNLIAAIHVADLLKSATGRNLLDRPGPFTQLEQWIGLPLPEIDHVVLGLKVDDRLLPRLIVVVETLRPFSKKELKEKLKGSRFRDPEAIRFPSDHSFIMGLTSDDLKAIPKPPPVPSPTRGGREGRGGINQLPPAIQTALRERIDKAARVWAVGASDDWERTVVLAYLNALPPPFPPPTGGGGHGWGDVLKNVQIFAIGLRMDQEMTLTVALKCSNDQAGQALDQFLNKQKIEAIRDLTINQENAWVTVQGKTSTEQIRQAFNQTISVQKK